MMKASNAGKGKRITVKFKSKTQRGRLIKRARELHRTIGEHLKVLGAQAVIAKSFTMAVHKDGEPGIAHDGMVAPFGNSTTASEMVVAFNKGRFDWSLFLSEPLTADWTVARE